MNRYRNPDFKGVEFYTFIHEAVQTPLLIATHLRVITGGTHAED